MPYCIVCGQGATQQFSLCLDHFKESYVANLIELFEQYKIAKQMLQLHLQNDSTCIETVMGYVQYGSKDYKYIMVRCVKWFLKKTEDPASWGPFTRDGTYPPGQVKERKVQISLWLYELLYQYGIHVLETHKDFRTVVYRKLTEFEREDSRFRAMIPKFKRICEKIY